MEKESLCLCEHAAYAAQGDINIEDFNLEIGRKKIIAIVSEDQSGTTVLQLIAGLKALTGGKISFPGRGDAKRKESLPAVQYVPDDIVCYDRISVADFLKGMSRHLPQALEEADRLLGMFEITPKEKLLDMTFEQNRLVGIIQALMGTPELLLLDRPYDMLRPETYRELLGEITSRCEKGAGIVLAASEYSDISIPCNEYIFMQEGKIRKKLARKELPRPAKVITMWGGSLKGMDESKLELLYKDKSDGCCRFLYREYNMKRLAESLSKSGCKNFNVGELSMEEEIFADYAGWMP